MVRIRRLGVVAGEDGLEGSAGGGALPVGHPGGQSFGQVVDGSREGWINYVEELTYPAPVSHKLIQLPGMGSPEAKALGYACIGGQAFRRLANGWEQVAAAGGSWQRCQGG